MDYLTTYIVPIIVLSVIMSCYCAYQIWINPFGWTSPCRMKYKISIGENIDIEIISPKPPMNISMVKSYVNEFSRDITELDTFEKILVRKSERIFSKGTTIIVRDGKRLLAIDIEGTDKNGPIYRVSETGCFMELDGIYVAITRVLSNKTHREIKAAA